MTTTTASSLRPTAVVFVPTRTTPRLNSLPVELRERVCSHLCGHSLKSLRLSSKAYAAIACRSLSITIQLVDEKDSCCKALEIARHPDMRRAVRSVVVDISRIRVPPTFGSWLRDLRLSSRGKWVEMQAWFEAHKELAIYQHDPETTTVLLDTLTEVFTSCPKLKDLVITHAFGTRQSRVSDKLLEEFNNFSPYLRLYYDIEQLPFHRSRFSLQQILKCLDSSTGHLETLTIMPAIFDHGDTSTCAPVPAVNLQTLKSLKHLQTLDIEDAVLAFLIPMLASANNIETLGICDRSAYPPRTDFFNVLRSSCLKEIKINGWTATPASFEAFLAHHGPTLLRFWVADSRLLVPQVPLHAWRSAWRPMAVRLAGRFPVLEFLILASAMDTVRTWLSRARQSVEVQYFRGTVMEGRRNVYYDNDDLRKGLLAEYKL